jgi:hypothetical protein
LFDTVNGTIAGFAVVEDNNMPDNQLVVEQTFLTIYEKSGIINRRLGKCTILAMLKQSKHVKEWQC